MKKYFTAQTLFFIVLVFSTTAFPEPVQKSNSESLFEEALLLYDAREYKSALPLFKQLVQLAPMESSYHHMLGKCYGRIAEEGSWLTALRNVRKTLNEFKKAVELDNNNIQALKDLEEFYRRAPVFLGGDMKKAEEINKRLSSLNMDGNREIPGNNEASVP
jgi:tetratricopeptide (TPR) repeat protein